MQDNLTAFHEGTKTRRIIHRTMTTPYYNYGNRTMKDNP